MMQIRVSPDGLRDVANVQQEVLNNVNVQISKMDEISGELRSAWNGVSGSQANNTFAGVKANCIKVADTIGDSISKLKSIADVFESVDAEGQGFVIHTFPDGLVPMPVFPNFVLNLQGTVEIDTDRVRDIAEQCKIVLNTLTENSDAFSNTLNGLSNIWEGRAFMKYQDEAKEIIKAFSVIVEDLSEFVPRIVNAANRYEEIDSSI